MQILRKDLRSCNSDSTIFMSSQCVSSDNERLFSFHIEMEKYWAFHFVLFCLLTEKVRALLPMCMSASWSENLIYFLSNWSTWTWGMKDVSHWFLDFVHWHFHFIARQSGFKNFHNRTIKRLSAGEFHFSPEKREEMYKQLALCKISQKKAGRRKRAVREWSDNRRWKECEW